MDRRPQDLEMMGWESLSMGQEVARRFFGSLLADDAMMLLPGATVLRGKEEILDSFAAQPWKQFRLDDMDVKTLGDCAAVVVYRATAAREGGQTYTALVSSTYVRNGTGWKLAFHQHTRE